MGNEGKRVRELIAEEFPSEMQRDVLGHLWKSYEEAWQTAKEFEPAQRRKVYGHHRLALIEKSFKLFCAKHPTLTAEDYRPDGGTYDYFTMSSRSLLISIKRVQARHTLPLQCLFRDTMAAGTQFHAFEDVAEVDGRKFFHVLILHNCERKLVYDEDTGEFKKIIVRSRPGFVDLAVPEREGNECIFETSLFDAHPKTVAQLRGLSVEDVSETDKKKPRARPKTDEGTDTGSK